MIPVSEDDVKARLRRDLSSTEIEFLPGIVDEASALLEGYLGVCYGDDETVPTAVVVIASRVAARILTMPEGPAGLADSRTSALGPFSATIQYSTDSSSGGPWLTKSDRIALAPYRARGAISVPLVREGIPTQWGNNLTEWGGS